jgi:hypothetical protein
MLQYQTIFAKMFSHFRELSHSSLLQCSTILATVLSHFSLSNNAKPFLLHYSAILATMLINFRELSHSLWYSAHPFPTNLQYSAIFHCYSACILRATVLDHFSLLQYSAISTATMLDHFLVATGSVISH